jgi:hypothetical protein
MKTMLRVITTRPTSNPIGSHAEQSLEAARERDRILQVASKCGFNIESGQATQTALLTI